MVICRDRRWRPFETRRIDPGPAGVWSWRKGIGMEEQDLFPGYGIHYCADYHNRAFQFTDNRAAGESS